MPYERLIFHVFTELNLQFIMETSRVIEQDSIIVCLFYLGVYSFIFIYSLSNYLSLSCFFIPFVLLLVLCFPFSLAKRLTFVSRLQYWLHITSFFITAKAGFTNLLCHLEAIIWVAIVFLYLFLYLCLYSVFGVVVCLFVSFRYAIFYFLPFRLVVQCSLV